VKMRVKFLIASPAARQEGNGECQPAQPVEQSAWKVDSSFGSSCRPFDPRMRSLIPAFIRKAGVETAEHQGDSDVALRDAVGRPRDRRRLSRGRSGASDGAFDRTGFGQPFGDVDSEGERAAVARRLVERFPICSVWIGQRYSGGGGSSGGSGQAFWQLALQLSPPQVTQVPAQVPPHELPHVSPHVLPHVWHVPPQLTAQEWTLASSWASFCSGALGLLKRTSRSKSASLKTALWATP